MDLAQRFEAERPRLQAMAVRMLGSTGEAEDAVQESWLRLARLDGAIGNVEGWLTTVVARVCLDLLRARRARCEESLTVERTIVSDNPEAQAILAEAFGEAMLRILDRLSPPERVAFVLHDAFGLSFEKIGPIVDRSADAARQLASRARRRVRGGEAPALDDERRIVIDTFRRAAREGDLAGLLAVLAPDVVVQTDAVGIEMGAQAEVRGAQAVAETFLGRAAAARPVFVDGRAGLAWMHGTTPRVVFDFTVVNERIAALDLIADPTRIAEVDLTSVP